ncbi:Tyrosinase [Smittium culicis]|uniref:Tyrosinase n=1 Tax=Smittium culicis TaxID=133412 RepID=A0A1R1YCH6_9FUNG|nr:Tyrosinase [Smittium culicis]OMJ24515.1 Tyrosinase [Smittium culicis]
MKISILLSSVLFSLSVRSQFDQGNQMQGNLPRCGNIITRRDIKSYSDSELNGLRDTVNYMRDNGWFSWFARVHTENFDAIHGGPVFLPWHRYFIYEFERLARNYNSNFAIPYYNSPEDFVDPASSIIFTDKYFGGNGVGPGNCVASGMQAGWSLNYPSPKCLNRAYNGGNRIQSWYNPAYVESLIQRNNNLDSFRSEIEYSQHGSVHIGLGGTMSSQESPSDIMFYLHHAYIDRVWWRWQTMNPNNMFSYNGRSPSGQVVSLRDNLVGYNTDVASVMQLGYGQMCYQYDGMSFNKNLKSEPGHLVDNKVEAGLRNLKPSILKKYFPLFSDKNQSSNSTLSKNMLSSNSSGSNSTVTKMPYPNEPDAMWLKMHGYDLGTAIKVRNIAVNLIDDLYDSGFSNPY